MVKFRNNKLFDNATNSEAVKLSISRPAAHSSIVSLLTFSLWSCADAAL